MPDVPLTIGANPLSIITIDPAGNRSETPLTVTRVAPTGDPQIVLDWDAALLSAIQTNASTAPEASRQMAIVHAAIYDAVNAITRTSGFLYVNSPAAADASAPAAVAAAAHRALSALFPAQTATFDALLDDSLDKIQDSQSKTDGIAIGQSKIFRDPVAGPIHAFIFWGFMVLLFAVIESIGEHIRRAEIDELH